MLWKMVRLLMALISLSLLQAKAKQPDVTKSLVPAPFYLYVNPDEKPVKLFTKPGFFEEISYPRWKAKADVKRWLACGAISKDSGEEHDITLSDGSAVKMSYYNRGSKKLIVLGQGWVDPRKRWKYVVPLLRDNDYDIVTFEYRMKAYWAPLGEKGVVEAVVLAARKLKNYEQVVGWAECYSCLTFVAAQIEVKERCHILLFDKLIFDSTLVSLPTMNANIFNRWCSWLLAWLTPSLSITPYMAKNTDTPILFIHGTQDRRISIKNLMNEAIKETKAPTVLVSTPYDHVHSGNDWGIYKFICDQFIQSASMADFIDRLKATI